MKEEFLRSGFHSLPPIDEALLSRLRKEVAEIRITEAGLKKIIKGDSGHWDGRFHPLELPAGVRELVQISQTAAAEVCPDLEFVEAQISHFPTGHTGWEGFHIDGVGSVDRGASFQITPDFLCIIGYCLDDRLSENLGNLTIIPEGMNEFAKRVDPKRENPLRAASEIFPRNGGKQMLLSAGEGVILHYAMPHRVSPNNGPERPMVYIRLGRPAVRGLQAYTDPRINYK